MSQILDSINQKVKDESGYMNIYSLFYLEKIKVNLKYWKNKKEY